MDKDRTRLYLAFQYFLYFGVLGVFLPYFNLYCYHLGFTGLQIGALSGLRSATLVLFPMIWAALADRYRIRRPIYIACNGLSALVWSLYFFTSDFPAMVMITMLYGVFYAPVIPFLEAFTMDALGGGKGRYGRIRMWGSLSFIMVVSILGRIIDRSSVRVVLEASMMGLVLMAVFSPKVPRSPGTGKGRSPSRAGELLQKRVILFLFSGFLMLLSHGTYYGFFSIHLENLGYSATFMGITWAVASAAEILVMLQSGWLFARYDLNGLLFFSFLVAALRWISLSLIVSPVLILLSQLLHAVTYGVFHMASILYMDRLAPESAKTMGQAVNNAVTYGLGMMVGFFVSGLLYGTTGLFLLFASSGLIAAAGAMVFRWSAPRPASAPGPSPDSGGDGAG